MIFGGKQDPAQQTRLLAKPLFSLVALLCLVIVIGSLLYVQTSNIKNVRSIAARSHQAIFHINLLSRLTMEAEERAHGLPVYEEKNVPDHRSMPSSGREMTHGRERNDRRIASEMEMIGQLLPEGSVQEEDWREVRPMLLGWLAVQGRGVEMSGDYLAVTALLRHLQQAEQAWLALYAGYDNDVVFGTVFLMVGMLIIVFLLVSGAFLAIEKEMKHRLGVERQLTERLVFEHALLDGSPYPIIATDRQGVIKMFNKAAEKLLGYRAEEVIDRMTPEKFHVPGNAQAMLARLAHPDAFMEAQESEIDYVSQEGKRIPVLLTVAPLKNERGETMGFIKIIKDITESRQVAIMKNEFISTVSHELRTPLTSIRGALGLVLGHGASALPARMQELLQIAYKNSERLVRLINGMLDIEKIESGKMLFDLHEIEMEPLLEQAVQEAAGFASSCGVHLKLENQAGQACVLADSDKLLQVIANLLSNAIKYSPEGGEVRILAARSEDKKLRVSVIDRGNGIPEAFKSRIFSKFAQADSSDTRQKGGTGLGLSISKAIMEMMHGEIGFRSEPGRTEFHILLPLAGRAASFAPELARSPELARIQVKQKSGRILICEDDPDIALLLKMLMEQEGFDCVIAHSAQAAVDLLAAENFSGMTLDLALPDKSGLDFIQELRAQERTRHLPVIVVSARAEAGQRQADSEESGVLDWLQKPIDLDRLKLLSRSIAQPSLSVLHVEDDSDIANVISQTLAPFASVHGASSLAEARILLDIHVFDLVILDISLPDGDGLELLPDIAAKAIPVAILSADETSREIQRQVASVMVKSVITEKRIIQTILSLLEQARKNA